MLKDAIDRIAELAANDKWPYQLPDGDAGRKRFLLRDGSIEELIVPPMPRAHMVTSLTTIGELAARFEAEGTGPACWLDESAVKLVIDDKGHRSQTAEFTLDWTTEYEAISRKAVEFAANPGAGWMNQRDFLRFLRVTLGATGASALVEPVRRVVWTSQASAVVARQGESMGRTINAQVGADGKDLPEDIDLTVRVFVNRECDFRLAMRCWLEVDATEQRFRLLPHADEHRRVVEVSLDVIADLLSGALPKGVPLYRGEP